MTDNLIPTLKRNYNPDHIEREINALTADDKPLKKASVINIPLLNLDVDKISFTIFTLGIIVIFVIWKSLGLFGLIAKNKFLLVLLVIQVLFFVLQIFISPKEFASVARETERLTIVSQISTVLLGSMVLFVVFKYNFTPIETRTIMTAIILNCVLFIYVSVENSGNQIRIVRKIKQTILNITAFLFIVVLYLSLSDTSRKRLLV